MSDRFNMFGETKDHVIQKQAARIEALEADRLKLVKEVLRISSERQARIEALEAALENEAIVSRDVFAHIEALEAAGKRLADAAVRLDADDITSALAAWRAAEGGGNA